MKDLSGDCAFGDHLTQAAEWITVNLWLRQEVNVRLRGHQQVAHKHLLGGVLREVARDSGVTTGPP